MDNFWILEASKNVKPPLIPGTSKWVSSEMAEFSSVVCLQAQTFEHSVNHNLEWLNDQINELIYFDDDLDTTTNNKITLLLKSPKKSPVRLVEKKSVASSIDNHNNNDINANKETNININTADDNKENLTVNINNSSFQPVHLDFNKKPTLTSIDSNARDLLDNANNPSAKKKKSSIAINPLYLSSPVEIKLQNINKGSGNTQRPDIFSNKVDLNPESIDHHDSPLKNHSLNSERRKSSRKSKQFAPLPSRTPLTIRKSTSSSNSNNINITGLVNSGQGVTKATYSNGVAKTKPKIGRPNTIKRKINKIREEKSTSPIKTKFGPPEAAKQHQKSSSVSPVTTKSSTGSISSTSRMANQDNQAGIGQYFSNALSRAKSIFKHSKVGSEASTNKNSYTATLNYNAGNAPLTRIIGKKSSPIKPSVGSITGSISSASTKQSTAISGVSSSTTATTTSTNNTNSETKSSSNHNDNNNNINGSSLVARLMAPTESSAAKSIKKVIPEESISPKHQLAVELQDESPTKNKTTKNYPTIALNKRSGNIGIGIGISSNTTLYPKLPTLVSPPKKLTKKDDQGSKIPSPSSKQQTTKSDKPSTKLSVFENNESIVTNNTTLKAQNPLKKVADVSKRKHSDVVEDAHNAGKPSNSDNSEETEGKKKRKTSEGNKGKTDDDEFKRIDINTFKTPISEKLKKDSTLSSIKKTSNITRLSFGNDDMENYNGKNFLKNSKKSDTKKKTSIGDSGSGSDTNQQQKADTSSTSFATPTNQSKFIGSQLMKSTLIKNAATTAAMFSGSADTSASNISHHSNERINPPIMLTPNNSYVDQSSVIITGSANISKLQKQQQLLAQKKHKYQHHHKQPKTVLPEIYSDSSDDGDPSVLKSWANSPELRNLLKNQQSVDPDHLFGPIGNLNLEEIFASHKMRANSKSFLSRSSSARWDDGDVLTRLEVENYKAQMGFKR